MVISQIQLEYRLSALLQLHLHSPFNTWLEWIWQRQLQDETRNIYVICFGVPDTSGLTVHPRFRNALCFMMTSPKETFAMLLVTGEFPSKRPATRSFDVFFDLRLNKRMSKQSWGWWFATPSHSLWRHRYVFFIVYFGSIWHIPQA